MMSVFGDYDPDDAWDASDPVDTQLRTLATRILWLVDHHDDTPELRDRVQRIIDDMERLRERLARGD